MYLIFLLDKIFKSKNMEEKPSKKKKSSHEYDEFLQEIDGIKEENEKKLQMVEIIEEDFDELEEEALKKEIYEQQRKMNELIVQNQQKIQLSSQKTASVSDSLVKVVSETNIVKIQNGIDEKYIETYTSADHLESSKRLVDICHNIILKGNILTGNCLDSSLKIQFSDCKCREVQLVECSTCKETLLWCTHVCALLFSTINNPTTVLRFDKFQEQIVTAPKSVLDLSFINSIKHHSEFYDLILQEVKLLKDPQHEYDKIKENQGQVELAPKPLKPSILNFELIYEDLLPVKKSNNIRIYQYEEKQSVSTLGRKCREYFHVKNQLLSNGDYMNSFYLLIHVLLPILKFDSTSVKKYENEALVKEVIVEIKKVLIEYHFKDHEIEELKKYLDDLKVEEENKKEIEIIKQFLRPWEDLILQKVLKGDREAYGVFTEEESLRDSRIDYLLSKKLYKECFHYAESIEKFTVCCDTLIEMGEIEKAMIIAQQKVEEIEYFIQFLSKLNKIELKKEQHEPLFQFIVFCYEQHFGDYMKPLRIIFFYLLSSLFCKIGKEETIYEFQNYVSDLLRIDDYLAIFAMLNDDKNTDVGLKLLMNAFDLTQTLSFELCIKLTEIQKESFFVKLLKRVKTTIDDLRILNQCSSLIPLNVEYSKVIFEHNIKNLQFQDHLKKHLEFLMNEKEFNFLNQVILKEFKLKQSDTIYHSNDFTYCEAIFDMIKNTNMIPSCLHVFELFTTKFLPPFSGYRIGDHDLSINCPCNSCQTIKTFQYNPNVFEIELTNPSEALQDSISQCPKLVITYSRRAQNFSYSSGVYVVKKVLGPTELLALERFKVKTKEMTNWLLEQNQDEIKKSLKKNHNPFVIFITSKKIPNDIGIEDIQKAFSSFNKVFDQMFILIRNEFMNEKKEFFDILESYYTKDSPSLKTIIKYRQLYETKISINEFKTVKDYFNQNNFLDSWQSYFKNIFIKPLYETYNNMEVTNHNDVVSLIEIFLQEEMTGLALSFCYKIPSFEIFENFAKLVIELKTKFNSTEETVFRGAYSQFIYSNKVYMNPKFDELIDLMMNNYPSMGFEMALTKTDALKRHVVSSIYDYTHNWLKTLFKYYQKMNRLHEWDRYFMGLTMTWSGKQKFVKTLKKDPDLKQ